MSHHQVSTTLVKSRIEGFMHLCSKMGLSSSLINPHYLSFENRASLVPLSELVQLENRMTKALGIPEVGILLSKECPKFKNAKSGIVGALAASCMTVGEAFQVAMKYNCLLSDGIKIELIETEDRAEFIYYRIIPSQKTRLDTEISIIDAYKIIRNFGTVYKVEFEFGIPSYAEQYVKIFDCPLRFDAPTNKIIFDKSILQMENPASQPYINTIITEHANKELEKLNARHTFKHQVRLIILEHLSSGIVSADFVAEKLHMSRQNLFRKLKGENVSFSSLLEEIRREIALKAISSNSHSLTELAFILGFSELSSFSRAYKRWFGRSPSAYVAEKG